MARFIVIISVDWEGRSLLPENLQAIAAFRRRHAHVPLQHLLNPAYYTRSGANGERTTEAIRQALRPGDEHGLHIHAWASLIAAAGVPTRNGAGFLDGAPEVIKAADDWGFYAHEPGYDLPVEHFEPEELDRILTSSRDLLVSNGFDRAVSFRAGGWMSGPKVQGALARVGFLQDCSAVDARLSVRRFGDIPLSRTLTELWPTIDETRLIGGPRAVANPQRR